MSEGEGSVDQPIPAFSARGWKLQDLLAISPNVQKVHRISALEYDDFKINESILKHESEGTPLVISDFHRKEAWDYNLLSPKWLVENAPNETMTARNVWNREDREMTVRKYLDYASTASHHALSGETVRFYGKDAPCPEQWAAWLHSGVIPSRLVPFGAEDLFSYFPEEERPETLMIYLGIGDTFTPCHKDPCSTVGSNLMTFAEEGASSFWFFTPTDEVYSVSHSFQDRLGTELDWETAFLLPEDFFQICDRTFVCEQKVGDFVLVPRRSCHQVVNKGGLTIKTSWSRVILEGLVEAIREETPMYRRVCRPEVYRTKLHCHRLIVHYSNVVAENANDVDAILEVTQALDALRVLVPTYDNILVAEWNRGHAKVKRYDRSAIPVCDFCGADIFQSFLECYDCVDTETNASGAYQICAMCYVEGRSCQCRTMEPVQRWPFMDLITARNTAASFVSRDLSVPVLQDIHFRSRQSNRIFSACIQLVHDRDTMGEAMDHPARCSMNVHNVEPHDTTRDNVVRCAGCNRGFCRLHSLLVRRSHSSDDILDTLDTDNRMQVYHKKHITSKTGKISPRDQFNDAFGDMYGWTKSEHRWPDPSIKASLRITWAAITFRKCHPINTSYSIAGWYDNEVFAASNVHTKVEEDEDEEGSSAQDPTYDPEVKDEDDRTPSPAEPTRKRRRSSSADLPLSSLLPVKHEDPGMSLGEPGPSNQDLSAPSLSDARPEHRSASLFSPETSPTDETIQVEDHPASKRPKVHDPSRRDSRGSNYDPGDMVLPLFGPSTPPPQPSQPLPLPARPDISPPGPQPLPAMDIDRPAQLSNNEPPAVNTAADDSLTVSRSDVLRSFLRLHKAIMDSQAHLPQNLKREIGHAILDHCSSLDITSFDLLPHNPLASTSRTMTTNGINGPNGSAFLEGQGSPSSRL